VLLAPPCRGLRGGGSIAPRRAASRYGSGGQQALQDGPQLLGELGPLEGVRDGSLDAAAPGAGVVKIALGLEAVERALRREYVERVGELDLATLAWLRPLEDLEDGRGQDVAPQHRQVGGCGARRGFLDELVDVVQTVPDLLAGDDAVVLRPILRHREERDHRAMGLED